jgi:ribosomal-protein-alanine N-acetyltransferase
MSAVEVRQMRWWDIPAVHAIETSIFMTDPWSVEQFWSELSQPTRRYFVAEIDGAIVGYAGSFVLTPEADVQTVGVAADQRGRGIGALLLTTLIEQAIQAQAAQLILEVRSDNGAAIAMYQRFGFERISSRPNYYAPDVDALIMRLRPLVVAVNHE